MSKRSIADFGDDALLRTSEIANVLGVHRNTVRLWSKNGIGPKLMRIGKNICACRAKDLREYINTRESA
jgi:predicted DNA-binding transcriptional regulator AlpA